MFVLFDPIFWAQLGLSDPFFWEFGIKTRNILNFYAWYNRIKQAQRNKGDRRVITSIEITDRQFRQKTFLFLTLHYT